MPPDLADSAAVSNGSVSNGSAATKPTEPSNQPSVRDLRAEFQAIQIGYQQQTRQFNTQLRDAETAEQRAQLMAKAPNHMEFIRAAMDLFRGHESDEAYIEMATWVLRTTDDDAAIAEVLKNVKTYQLDNGQIVSFLQVAISQKTPLATKFVTTLADQGDSPASMVARLVTIAILSPETDQQRVIQLLESVANYDGEIVFEGTDFKAIAAGQLFSLTRLQIGAEAPEIEGEDLDGITFKLSDYRGKVVMLDFWGHW
jgi:hypothetical protein